MENNVVRNVYNEPTLDNLSQGKFTVVKMKPTMYSSQQSSKNTWIRQSYLSRSRTAVKLNTWYGKLDRIESVAFSGVFLVYM